MLTLINLTVDVDSMNMVSVSGHMGIYIYQRLAYPKNDQRVIVIYNLMLLMGCIGNVYHRLINSRK